MVLIGEEREEGKYRLCGIQTKVRHKLHKGSTNLNMPSSGERWYNPKPRKGRKS